MKYITTQETPYYMASGNLGGRYPSGKVFESVGTATIKSLFCRNIEGTREYIPDANCKEYIVEPPPDEPPVEPPTDTFPSYIPVGAEWQMRFKLTSDSDWTEYYTFKRLE